MTARVMQATFRGRTYSIPEIWVAGFCSTGHTVVEAVAWWAWQTELAEREEER
jgi:hypothetical protein